MVSNEQYVASIVEKYRVEVDTGSPVHCAADKILPLLKKWGKEYLLGLTLSGAYAKNTAVSLASHVDVLIALAPIPGMEMKNIFWNLFEYLTEQNLRARTREVSVQVEQKDFRIDLIPAWREHGHNVLFNKKTGSCVSTDVAQHVHLVANSGRQQEICAIKIWRERNGLYFPSFCLELAVLRALEHELFGHLADNVRAVMRFLSGRFEKTVLRDPANEENVVSDDLSAEERAVIAKAASNALYEENWKKMLW
jgi:hypothetical protein